MSWLKEGIEALRALCRDADDIGVFAHDSLPEKVFFRHGTHHEMLDVPPVRRNHEVHGYADFVAAASSDMVSGAGAQVFHSDDGLWLLLDRGDRRDRVWMELVHSSRFARLAELTGTNALFDVRGAVRLLRFDLHGTGTESVEQALSKIDFTRRSDGYAHVEHGKESLGRAVEASVRQAADVPREFTVSSPVYMNDGLVDLTTIGVRCGVYLDLENSKIQIVCLSDEVRRALNAAQRLIGDKLRSDLPGIEIYHGAP